MSFIQKTMDLCFLRRERCENIHISFFVSLFFFFAFVCLFVCLIFFPYCVFFFVVVGGFDMTMAASPWVCLAISHFCFDLFVWNHLSTTSGKIRKVTLPSCYLKEEGGCLWQPIFFLLFFFALPSSSSFWAHPFLPFLFLVVDICFVVDWLIGCCCYCLVVVVIFLMVVVIVIPLLFKFFSDYCCLCCCLFACLLLLCYCIIICN